MSVLNRIKKSIASYYDKKKEEREYEEKLEKEARATERKIYEQEYRKASYKASLIRARRDAVNKSGLAKLRAIHQKYGSPKQQTGFFGKLSEYTKANRLRNEQLMKRNAEIRKAIGKDIPQRSNLRYAKPIPSRQKRPLFRY